MLCKNTKPDFEELQAQQLPCFVRSTHSTKLLHKPFLLVFTQDPPPSQQTKFEYCLNIADLIGIFHICPQIQSFEMQKPLSKPTPQGTDKSSNHSIHPLLRLTSGPFGLAALQDGLLHKFGLMLLAVLVILYCCNPHHTECQQLMSNTGWIKVGAE